MAHLLGAESLRVEFPTKLVLDSVTVGVSEGDRIGIVGRNGDGKSTLLSLLSGRSAPDSGKVTRRSGVTVGVLDQKDTLDPALSVSTTIVGDRPEYEWRGNARIRDVLAGLLKDVPWEAVVGALSGGQRQRVALARLLVGDWDVLALDEPSNHLDLEAVGWPANHLKNRWPANAGGLLVVTHDRWLLDEVCTATWEVHDRKVEPFEGGYAAYVLQKVERDRIAAATEAKRQNLMRKELAWLRRGAPARTRKPKFRIEAANALIASEPPPRDRVELSQMATARMGKQVVDMEGVSVAYGDQQVLTGVEWSLAPGERSGVLGANGAGKSTLLSVIAGRMDATEGVVRRGKNTKVAVLDQQVHDLDNILDERVSEVVSRLRASYRTGGRDVTPAQLLERLGFGSAQLAAPVRELSGGQRRRLHFLLTLLDEPNVLILDEPTNDMDVDMLAAIEDLLDSWPGTLLVVSHDRYFLERVTDQQYAVLHGHLRHLPGGIDEYLRLASRPAPLPGNQKATGRAAGDQARRADGHPSLAAAQRSAKKEIATIERKLTRLSTEIAGVQEAIASHGPGDYEVLAQRTDELGTLQEQIDELETRWLELSELID